MRTLVLDVETTKKPIFHPWQKDAKLVAVGLSDLRGWHKRWIFNHNEWRDPVPHRELIHEIQQEVNLADRLIGHNLKFDLNWTAHIGVDYGHCKLFCTQNAEYLIRAQRIGELTLGDLSHKYLNVPKMDRVKLMWDAGYETTEIPLKLLLPYLEQDCINAGAIYQRQVPILKAENLMPLATVLNENTRVLSVIERNGMKLDKDEAMFHVKNLRQKLDELNSDIQEAFGVEINLDSGPELSAALYGGVIQRPREVWTIRELKSKPESTYKMTTVHDAITLKGMGFAVDKSMELVKAGTYKTDKNTIKYLKGKTKAQTAVKEWLVARSTHAQALSTLLGKDGKGIINKVQADNLVHAKYNMTVTKTGRLSSSDPNGQNLPREGTSPIKQSFVPRFDYIMEADIGKAEWVAVAILSRDPVMMDEIRRGVDPHTENAIAFFGVSREAIESGDKDADEIRTIAKIMTFRLIYGGSAYSFYMDQKMPNYSLAKWDQIVKAFYDKYRGLKLWQIENIRMVNESRGILINPTGRKFQFFQGPKGYRPQQIKNFPVQSFATADIMPLAMVTIYRRYIAAKFESLLIGQVHDSLIWDAKKAEMQAIGKMCVDVFEHLPEYIMQLWPNINFDLPLSGDIKYGKSWGNLAKLELT